MHFLPAIIVACQLLGLLFYLDLVLTSPGILKDTQGAAFLGVAGVLVLVLALGATRTELGSRVEK